MGTHDDVNPCRCGTNTAAISYLYLYWPHNYMLRFILIYTINIFNNTFFWALFIPFMVKRYVMVNV